MRNCQAARDWAPRHDPHGAAGTQMFMDASLARNERPTY